MLVVGTPGVGPGTFAAVAAQIGRTLGAVAQKRAALKVPAKRGRGRSKTEP
jgi:hypothetical protein